MAKRLLSMIVSLALLLSCISGITLFTAAEDLPEPFGYFDFGGTRGMVQKSGGVVRPIMANNNENTSDLRGGSAIGSTGLYGYKITREGLGVYFGGALLNNVPDGTGVTYAVEYYIDSAEPLEGDVMLVTDSVNGDKTFADLTVGAKGVVFYSLSADAVDAIQAGENSDTRLRVKALGAGGGKLYVLGVKILDSQYTGMAEAVPYSYYDFEKTLSNEYYPEESSPDAYQLSCEDKEVGDPEGFEGYRYFSLTKDAPAFAASATENKAVYLRFFTKEGYENTTITLNSYQVYGETDGGEMAATHSTLVKGAPAVSATVTDGVGTAVIPAACFRNSAGYGSFRLLVTEAEKLARVEVYDMATYCAAADAEADTVAAMHAAMLANKVNTKLLNAKDATDLETGYTGDTVCATCETQLAAGEEIPVNNTSGLPTPYAWFNTNSGALTSNRVLGPADAGDTDVTKIPGTNEYGIGLDADWSGFWIGGKFFEEVPADQSITMVVEYYITGDMSGRQQLFRYQSYSGMEWKDMFTDTDNLVGGKSGVFCHTYTAEERAAIENGDTDGDLRFTILGCDAGAGRVYIQSVRLVNTEYVHTLTDGGYAVWDMNEQVICDYYPDITMSRSSNLGIKPEGSLFMHFVVGGDALSADANVNKPVYIKVYTKEGYENTTVTIQQFEAYTASGRWACDNGYAHPQITVIDGVGSVLLPETSFTNGNNDGSFRFAMAEFNKIARIEVYDVNTFCLNEKASAEDVAAFHAMFISKNLNIEKIGRVEATTETEGYTGDAKCTICQKVVAEGTVIPVIDPNRPLVTLNTANGELTYTGCTLAPQGDNGHFNVSPIGETGEFGIRLDDDWFGFNLNDVSLTGAPGQVVMLIEYYINREMPENLQMFRYKIGDRPHVDVFTASHNLVSGKSGLVYHIFTEEEMAAIGDNNFTFSITGCAAGANTTYIQSVQLVSIDRLNMETDKGYVYTEFEEKTITDLYPDITAIPSYNMGYANLESNKVEYPQHDWLYRYFTVAGAPMAVNNESKPVYIKLYATEGYENEIISIHAIERSKGSFGAGASVQMVDGVGGVFISSATFTNGLNGAGSLRIWCEEVPKIARIEIYDAASYCGREDADPALVEMFHAGMKEDLVNIKRVGKVDPTEEAEGYTGDIYCATCDELFALGTTLPKLEVSDLKAPYAYFDTANGYLRYDGLTLADQGSAPVATPIGGSGEYGIKLTGDWQGFRMEGLKLPEGKDVTMAIEYYINADITSRTQLFRIQAYEGMPGDKLPDGTDNGWDDIFSDENSIVNRTSGLLFYHFDEEDVAAINNGEFIFRILGCGPGANITYIQSVRLIDSEYVTSGAELGYDYMSFVEEPLCEYYPTITGTQSSGMSLSKTEEGVDANNDNEPVRYGYFKVTSALVGPTAPYRPVVVRFYLKEECEITNFQFSYQAKRRADPSDGTEWAHINVEVVDGYAEVLLEQACLDNSLNGLGSIRVPNHPSLPVVDNLTLIEVVGLADTSVLKSLVEGVEEDVIGKSKESADAYRELVAQYAVLLEDLWVNALDVEAAVAALQAAAEAMEDCVHDGDTVVLRALEVVNHVVPGYTGDTHCAECNLMLAEGEVISAHYTDIINVKDPTCGEPGNSGDRWCFDCDELVAAGESIMPLPHTWDDGVVTKPATPDTKGELTLTCTVCGDTKTIRFAFEPELGDANEDGSIDSTDARLVLQFAVRKIDPATVNLDMADVDGNGRVDSTDARLILQYAVRKIDTFPEA